MRMFYDTEHDCLVTFDDLMNEFLSLKRENGTDAEDFREYVNNCMTYNNGTLEEITKEKATAFWRDLKGIYWHNPDRKGTGATVYQWAVAERMDITEGKANAFLWACIEYGLTDRQGGGFAI